MLPVLARALARRAHEQGVMGGRAMAASAGHKAGVTYKGVTIQPPSTGHIVASEVLGGLLWSWLLIRIYEDGAGLIFGHTKHLDHELHALQHGDESH
jgi:hypothetical protein